MENYIIKQLERDIVFLVNINYDSILNYKDELEKENIIKTSAGILIIDQLLVTGDGRNRFISCQYSYGFIDFSGAKNITGTIKYKTITAELLKNKIGILQNTILRDNQILRIEKGISI